MSRQPCVFIMCYVFKDMIPFHPVEIQTPTSSQSILLPQLHSLAQVRSHQRSGGACMRGQTETQLPSASNRHQFLAARHFLLLSIKISESVSTYVTGKQYRGWPKSGTGRRMPLSRRTPFCTELIPSRIDWRSACNQAWLGKFGHHC